MNHLIVKNGEEKKFKPVNAVNKICRFVGDVVVVSKFVKIV